MTTLGRGGTPDTGCRTPLQLSVITVVCRGCLLAESSACETCRSTDDPSTDEEDEETGTERRCLSSACSRSLFDVLIVSQTVKQLCQLEHCITLLSMLVSCVIAY